VNRAFRYLAHHPFVRFGLVGAAGYVVDAGVLSLDTGVLKLDFEAGRFLSIFVAMTFTWLGNRYFTFAERRARGSIGAIVQEWLKFMGANLVGAVVNYTVSVLLVHFAHAPFSNKFAAQAGGVLAGLIFNFTLSHTLVFRGSR
jgi:putative flippase GtrA